MTSGTARNSNIVTLLLQIKDLNKGTFGFVQLAVDVQTGQRFAIKFIERGDKVYLIVFPTYASSSRHNTLHVATLQKI